MRISYAPLSPPSDDPDTVAAYEHISARRAPRPFIALDRALLHNPSIADGYSSFLGAIRSKSSLPVDLMELAICYVAVLNDAVYEWTAHAPLAMKAGVSGEKLQAVLDKDISSTQNFSALELRVLAYTQQSTRDIAVQEDLVNELKTTFTEQQIMELSITVAAYNMVSRFLVSLDVSESNGKKMEVPKEINIIA